MEEDQKLLKFLAGPACCLRCGGEIEWGCYDVQEDWCGSCAEKASREGLYKELIIARNTISGMKERIERLKFSAEYEYDRAESYLNEIEKIKGNESDCEKDVPNLAHEISNAQRERDKTRKDDFNEY